MNIDQVKLKNTIFNAAKAASNVTLPLFRSPLIVENKLKQGFDPVTEADKEAEKIIRKIIEADFPDHSIFGEELEDKLTSSPYHWIIDPIDGTRAFISGLPVWGTLIGLFKDNKPVAGLMAQPFTGEIYLAINGKSELIHKGKITELKSSKTKQLEQAIMFTTTPKLFTTKQQLAAFHDIEDRVRLSRYGVDCYAYSLLAAGQIDLVIEANLKACDIAPLIAIIENAGGIVSTWDRKSAHEGGNIIASATPELFDEAYEILQKHLR